MNNKRNAVIAALFEKKNKRKPKNSKELSDFVQSQGGEEFLKKVDEYIDQAEKDLALQAQKAAHGAKLQYFRHLKNQCAEDEELVYYKKGGIVDCGCQKKQKGGNVPPKKLSVVDKFKSVKKNKFGNTIARIADATGSQGGFKNALKPTKVLKPEEYWDKHGNYIVSKKKMNERQKLFDSNKTKEETTPPKINKGIGKNENGAKLKKGVCPKCGKVHAAGMGCHLSKIKVSCGGSKLKK